VLLNVSLELVSIDSAAQTPCISRLKMKITTKDLQTPPAPFINKYAYVKLYKLVLIITPEHYSDQQTLNLC
jgi:hypothetical protein